MSSNGVCSIPGCDRRLYSRLGCPDGWCAKHHGSWRKYGDPLVGFYASFDERIEQTAHGGCWAWTGGNVPGGYGVFHCQYVHRIAYERATGEPIPAHMQVDHICHNRKCVNPDHLRLTTGKQNRENRLGAQANNVTGLRGVGKRGTRYLARVRHHGRDYNLGMFDTPEEAAEAARLKRIELFTHNDLDRVG